MVRLTPDLIDPDINPEHDLGRPFGGLVLGQLRDGPTVVIKDAVWYNADGRRLGWGSLSASDFTAVQKDLSEPRWHLDGNEKFVVVSAGVVAGEYLRRHHPNFNRLGDHTVFEIGPDYLASQATFIVTREEFVIVMRAGSPGGSLKYPGGIAFRAVSPGEFTNLIQAVPIG